MKPRGKRHNRHQHQLVLLLFVTKLLARITNADAAIDLAFASPPPRRLSSLPLMMSPSLSSSLTQLHLQRHCRRSRRRKVVLSTRMPVALASSSKSSFDSIREEFNLNRYSSSLQSITTPSSPIKDVLVDNQQSSKRMIREESLQYAIIDPSPREVAWQKTVSAIVRPMKSLNRAVRQVSSSASASGNESKKSSSSSSSTATTTNTKKKMGSLILLRCGESSWTKTGRFTGWADPDLVTEGILEMEHASRLLLSEGYEADIIYTSRLKRAVKSTWIVLNGLGAVYLPVYKSWRLNERHYGTLTGLKKMDAARELGSEVVQAW